MNTIYLQRSLSINGRSALRGRKLVDQLRSVSDDLLLGHIIYPEVTAAQAHPEIRKDVISELEMLKFSPDVIIMEGGLFSGSMWRIPEDMATAFVENGGTIIVADVDVNDLRNDPRTRTAYTEATDFLGASISEVIQTFKARKDSATW